MTDLTYVVAGRWDDVEWRLAAAKPASQRTSVEEALFQAGPRMHPWGPLAVVVLNLVEDGESVALVFPSQEAADAYEAAHAAAYAPTAPVAPVAPVTLVDPFHAVETDHPSEATE